MSSSGASSSFDQKITQLSLELDNLRSTYDLYFSDQLRREPSKEHAEWKRKFNALQSSDTKSTGQKFRLKNLQSRYIQLSTLWSKICKQIEEGTYRREKFLSQRSKQNERSEDLKDTQNTEKWIDSVYEKILRASSKSGAQIPQKDKFTESLKLQVKQFRTKHPHKKLEIKVLKDKNGAFKIQLRPASKKS